MCYRAAYMLAKRRFLASSEREKATFEAEFQKKSNAASNLDFFARVGLSASKCGSFRRKTSSQAQSKDGCGIKSRARG